MCPHPALFLLPRALCEEINKLSEGQGSPARGIINLKNKILVAILMGILSFGVQHLLSEIPRIVGVHPIVPPPIDPSLDDSPCEIDVD